MLRGFIFFIADNSHLWPILRCDERKLRNFQILEQGVLFLEKEAAKLHWTKRRWKEYKPRFFDKVGSLFWLIFIWHQMPLISWFIRVVPSIKTSIDFSLIIVLWIILMSQLVNFLIGILQHWSYRLKSYVKASKYWKTQYEIFFRPWNGLFFKLLSFNRMIWP